MHFFHFMDRDATLLRDEAIWTRELVLRPRHLTIS